MVAAPRLLAPFVVSLLSLQCAAVGVHSNTVLVTSSQRLSVLRQANVWRPTDIAAMDIKTGPAHVDGFPPDATVACDYRDERLGGASAKFSCAISSEDKVKVRYGRDNGEVYAGVAATRLLWALGFGADAMFPVHVVCRGCPAALIGDGPAASGQTRFDIAAIERKMPGRDLEAPNVGPGWAWPEIDLVDEREGGAPVAHREALKLLAVFLQHTDNKAEQQRLICTGRHTKGSNECLDPFLIIHDVGQTFGGANLFNRSSVGSVNLEQWSRAPVWKDQAHCIGNLAQSQTGSLSNPVISEAGRKFLADLLAQLTDAQLHDLFTVARFAEKPGSGGAKKASTVDGWVSAFKHKRDEVSGATCH